MTQKSGKRGGFAKVSKKARLDVLLIEKRLVSSRQRGRALIMAGKVFVNNQRIDKQGVLVAKDDDIVLKGTDITYVGRGGLKLEKALKSFKIKVDGLVCLDVGASTGGFTDCLLQHGAACVFAVDVGYGQLDWKLRQDPGVVIIERTNIRNMSALPQLVDLVTIDVSFISLKIVVPSVIKFLKQDSRIIALIKPQFEVGKGKIGKGGVVRDSNLHNEVIKDLSEFFTKTGLKCESVIPSPLLGHKGNKEFFISLTYVF
ncbi:MAG: TlyA family RNA methyltransferase [Desulfobacteraceae bacterium]|nr:TlyA family RNA methyltransferase [Desulfobacteraceae bacterium]MBC2718042.1 TlyA family RNA methyltransferase [Desulfobacteraceae bacterium]